MKHVLTSSSEDTTLFLFLNCSGSRKMLVNWRYTAAYKVMLPFSRVDQASFVAKQFNGKPNTTVFKTNIIKSDSKHLSVLQIHIDLQKNLTLRPVLWVGLTTVLCLHQAGHQEV